MVKVNKKNNLSNDTLKVVSTVQVLTFDWFVFWVWTSLIALLSLFVIFVLYKMMVA